MDEQTASSPPTPPEEISNDTGRANDKKYNKPRVLLEWTGPSRVHVEREHNFFIALFITAVIAAFVLVLMREYTLMLVVFALAFTVYAANKHEPKMVTYQITSTAIIIDGQRFSYDDLTSFWFEKEGGQFVLKVGTNMFNPSYLDMVINRESRNAIEDELLEYLPYEEVEESKIIKFIRRLVLPISHPDDESMPPIQSSEPIQSTPPEESSSETEEQQ